MKYIIVNAETGEHIIADENIKYLNKGDLIDVNETKTLTVWFKNYDMFSNVFYVQTEEC